MKSYALVFRGLLCLLTIFCMQNVDAGFTNSGRMQSKNINMSVGGTLDNNGELIGLETANLSCDTLSGKGLISAPQVFIQSKIFAFSGTIECKEKCTIIAGAKFNEKMFMRKGRGEFVIIIDENLGVPGGINMNSMRFMKDYEYDVSDELQLCIE